LTPLGLDLASEQDCDDGRVLAAELIGPDVALALTFRRVQQITVSTVFVYRRAGEIAGVLGMVAIRPDGLDAIRQHRFDPKNPPTEFLCRPGDPFAAMYGWGIVGRTRKASATVVAGAMTLRDQYPDLPFFTRAVTPAGAKVVRGRLGYSPYPGAPDGLLWNPVRHPSQERAA
jgi:hypothetical protein